MKPNFRQLLREEFDLTVPMATWIVVTHVFVLACPLALIWAVSGYPDAAMTMFASPMLMQVAAAVYIASTAFEVAQNSADRWYLTEATRSVADCFFNSFMTLSFSLFTFGLLGAGWPAWLTLVLTAAYPVAYVFNHPAHRGISGTVVAVATLAFYLVSGDPVVWLFMVGNFLGVFFITLMIRTRAQFLHGLGALFFGIGFLSWPWAIMNAAAGVTMSWLVFGALTAAALILALVLLPLLAKLSATPRFYEA